jgi:hypothetical protein
MINLWLYNIKPFTFRPLSIGNTYENELYVPVTYIGKNETIPDTSFTETFLLKKYVSLFPTISIDAASNKGTAGK